MPQQVAHWRVGPRASVAVARSGTSMRTRAPATGTALLRYTCTAVTSYRGRSGRKKSGHGTPPDGGTFLGCRKFDFWFPLARKKPEIRFSTPGAGLPGQKSIKRTQKCVVLGVFGHFPFPQNFKMPVRQKYFRL